MPALAIELPLSTTIMLRSIADVARSEGERITAPDTRLACLQVFALGGRTKNDDAAESAYFAIRVGLARALAEAAQYMAEKGLVQEGAPAVVRFIVQVAARYGVVVSEKTAAQALPLIGAAGGALVNTLFMDHFQDVARGHFIVRRRAQYVGALPTTTQTRAARRYVGRRVNAPGRRSSRRPTPVTLAARIMTVRCRSERFAMPLVRSRASAVAEPARAPPLPEAIALATADGRGRPSVRYVLLKHVDARGFVFFTDGRSRKGAELAGESRGRLRVSTGTRSASRCGSKVG